MNRAKTTCSLCGGTGLVGRPPSDVVEVKEWHRHLFEQEVCGRCGGSGKVEFDVSVVKNAEG